MTIEEKQSKVYDIVKTMVTVCMSQTCLDCTFGPKLDCLGQIDLWCGFFNHELAFNRKLIPMPLKQCYELFSSGELVFENGD